MVKLSLIVPVYNMEAYLGRCMDSLLAQTARDFEIILVDDGSTDQSAAMCDQYAERYPELVRVIHKANSGLSSARNAGIDAANGEFITFPDPDDWVEPNYVAEFLKVQQNQVGLVCTGYYVDFSDRCVPALDDQPPALFDRKKAQTALLIPPQMGGFAWNKCYKLDIIRVHELKFRSDVGTVEDLEFAFRYLKHCGAVWFEPSVRTYHYFQRDGAATRSGLSRHKMNSLRAYQLIADDCREEHPELERAAKAASCSAAVYLLWLYQSGRLSEPAMESTLVRHIRQTLPVLLKSPHYGIKHKLQAILAGYCPRVYGFLKSRAGRTESK